MADKFIPPGDRAFATRAQGFAKVIARDPQRFGISREDADAFARAAEDFRVKLQAVSNKFTRSKQLLMQKDTARERARRLMERLGRILRANDQLGTPDRAAEKVTSSIS